MKNGFTMIEALLAMMATMIVASMCALMIQVQAHFIRSESNTQDQMAILQIRQMVAVSDTLEIQDNQLNIRYNHETFTLIEDRNRLVKTKGYEILMEGIQNAQFYKQEDDIFFTYKKKGKTYTYQIA